MLFVCELVNWMNDGLIFNCWLFFFLLLKWNVSKIIEFYCLMKWKTNISMFKWQFSSDKFGLHSPVFLFRWGRKLTQSKRAGDKGFYSGHCITHSLANCTIFPCIVRPNEANRSLIVWNLAQICVAAVCHFFFLLLLLSFTFADML